MSTISKNIYEKMIPLTSLMSSIG